MATVILTIHLIIALALIIVVLLQRSEGGGLGIGGGGGGGGVMTGRSAATALVKLTWMLGAAFVVTSLTLTILAATDTDSRSVIEEVGGTAEGGNDSDSDSPLGGDLLPTLPDDGPSAPPPVE